MSQNPSATTPSSTEVTPLVWITGASAGIGAALARRMVELGWRVALSARSGDALAQLAAQLGTAAQALPLDVTNRAQLADAWRRICTDGGVPDLVVLNAGVWFADTAQNIQPQEVQRLIEVNLLGVVNAMALVAPAMMQRGAGQIVVVASVAGYGGLPGAAGYCASKAALQAWCEAMQPELAAAGVSLMVANPGFVDTPMTSVNDFPMPFMMTPEAAAAAILKGLDRRAPSFAFPLPMAIGVRLLSILPARLRLAFKKRMLRRASA